MCSVNAPDQLLVDLPGLISDSFVHSTSNGFATCMLQPQTLSTLNCFSRRVLAGNAWCPWHLACGDLGMPRPVLSERVDGISCQDDMTFLLLLRLLLFTTTPPIRAPTRTPLLMLLRPRLLRLQLLLQLLLLLPLLLSRQVGAKNDDYDYYF